MKIKNLISVLCLINLSSKAQSYLGINAGASISNYRTKVNGTNDGFKQAPGYILSGDVNIPLAGNLLFQSGLQFESIATKINTNSTQTVGSTVYKRVFDAKGNIGYINIPVKMLYKIPITKNNFIIGGGAFIGIGIGGKSSSSEVTEATTGSSTVRSVYNYSSKNKFGSADTTIKRMNFGVGLNAGYALASNIIFSVYSNIGLANINNNKGYSTKTFAAGIKIGYIFGKKE